MTNSHELHEPIRELTSDELNQIAGGDIGEVVGAVGNAVATGLTILMMPALVSLCLHPLL